MRRLLWQTGNGSLTVQLVRVIRVGENSLTLTMTRQYSYVRTDLSVDNTDGGGVGVSREGLDGMSDGIWFFPTVDGGEREVEFKYKNSSLVSKDVEIFTRFSFSFHWYPPPPPLPTRPQCRHRPLTT